MTFDPQIHDLKFALYECAGLRSSLQEAQNLDAFSEFSEELVDAVLTEAGKFASERISPLNQSGDVEGCTLKDGEVLTPEGWAELYRDWAGAGWNALACPIEYGGQGLPVCLGFAAQELWNTGSLSFAIGTVLTAGAVEALEHHASEELKNKYLPKLVSGEWMGTMNLTEPQAGSDLGALKTKAVPQDDGTYLITGSKIFITYGEHTLTENIIHLVLARLPGSAEGTKGISLFLVPKYLVGDDGELGARNDVQSVGLEHKLGIHASPTCVMNYGDKDGAKGWLIGAEGRGLNAMFTMMNNARLAVAIQGVAVAERATQAALHYAKERKQGSRAGSEGSVAIIEHPDVQVMLMEMKAHTMVARALCAANALALDLSADPDQDFFETQKMRADFLTPLSKAYSTDIGFEVASLGVQVHGGMGYVEETGAAQYLRDARILSIYEGTNGIQALDFLMRKLPLKDGTYAKEFLKELVGYCVSAKQENDQELGGIAGELEKAIARLGAASEKMLVLLSQIDECAQYQATGFARCFASVTGASLFLRGLNGLLQQNSGNTAQCEEYKIILCFYVAKILPIQLAMLSDSVDENDNLGHWRQNPFA